jgi:GH15 family glucan-1,4-alpha-glucosidase
LAWTVGAVWGGLRAAANFADAFGEDRLVSKYKRAADEIRAGAEEHLYQRDEACFARKLERRDDGGWAVDMTADASLMGLWYFGMLPSDDSRIVSTMERIRDRLWVNTDIGGVARYEGDEYQRVSEDREQVPGNPWFICTLWVAQWHIANATSKEALEPALELLYWAASHSLPSGVMAEQVHPFTSAPISVSPLTWSHSTLVMTVLEYLDRLREMDASDSAESG